MKSARTIICGGAPFIHRPESTSSLIWETFFCLLPAAAWGVYSFGIRAAGVLGVACIAACVGELALMGLRGSFTVKDGSACLTGLLIGMAMPSNVPLYIPILSALFAVLIVKGAFGGLGSNWMNPALGGIVFSMLNWPKQMSLWLLPRQLSGVTGISGATPLGFVRNQLAVAGNTESPISLLGIGGFDFTAVDRQITAFLNTAFFRPFNVELPAGYMDLLIGNRPGSIGELSGILLLAASVYLIARKSLRWIIPLAMSGSYGLLVWIFGGLPFGGSLFSGDVLFSLFSGSFVLVAFFMATDPVSSPSRTASAVLFGIGAGTLTFLLRAFGSRAEGTAFAVLVMNCLVPLMERQNAVPILKRGKAA